MNSPLPWPGRRERRTAGAAGAVASPKAHPTALGHAALAGDGGGAGRGVDADADPDRVLCVNELPHDHHIPLKTHMNPDENQLYKQFPACNVQPTRTSLRNIHQTNGLHKGRRQDGPQHRQMLRNG